MSNSESRVNDQLELDEGIQAMVLIDSMDSYLNHLPAESLDNLIIVSMQDHPRKMEKYFQEKEVDSENITIIPVSGSNLKYDGELNVKERTGPNDLTGIGVRLTESIEESDGEELWVVFDNINILLMYADERRVYRFLDTLIGKIRSKKGRGAYFTVRSAISDDTYSKLKQLSDEQIDLQ